MSHRHAERTSDGNSSSTKSPYFQVCQADKRTHRPHSYVSHYSGESSRLRVPHATAVPSSVACSSALTPPPLLSSFSILFLSVLILPQLYPNRQPGIFISIRSNQDSYNPCNQYIIAPASYHLRPLCTDYHWGLLILAVVSGSAASCIWGPCGRFRGWVWGIHLSLGKVCWDY